MDQISHFKENQVNNNRGPYLRRITPAHYNPRLLALAGFGAGAAVASAVAAVVYFNAISNPPVLESAPPSSEKVTAEPASVPVVETRISAPVPSPKMDQAAEQEPVNPVPAVPADAPAAKTASASPEGVAEPEPALAPSAVTVVQSPLEPKRVTTMVIRPAPPVPAADDARWAVAAPVARNKALEVLREKLASSEVETNDTGTPDQTVTTSLAPADPPKGQPLSRSVVSATSPIKTTKKALVSQAVKLRAGPDNNSAVVGVLPARAEVGLGSCKGWCQVSYQGKSGYVWKKYLRPAKPLNALAGG